MKTQGIGRTLCRERERRRVSLDAISRATNVRRDYLELIDEERLDRLPPGAYAKGFIRAYANYLGLDHRPYVLAYEQTCEQPAPELSAVVRHPVRVPQAAQPRAWRLAATAALGALVILGLLGAFRSTDEPAATPIVTAPAASIDPPGPNPLGAVVRIEALDGESWFRVVPDTGEPTEGVLQPGEERTFVGDETVELTLGNPSVVMVSANGQPGQRPRTESYSGVFTKTTTELPPNQATD